MPKKETLFYRLFEIELDWLFNQFFFIKNRMVRIDHSVFYIAEIEICEFSGISSKFYPCRADRLSVRLKKRGSSSARE